MAERGGVSTDGNERPTFLAHRIDVEKGGEEITVWNHLTVTTEHYVQAGQIESNHRVVCGDHPNGKPPEYITPEMAEQLRSLDIYPFAEIVDPHDDEVTVL